MVANASQAAGHSTQDASQEHAYLTQPLSKLSHYLAEVRAVF